MEFNKLVILIFGLCLYPCTNSNEEECIIFNFEDELNYDESTCGDSFTEWTLAHYTSSDIPQLNQASDIYITPRITLSCISFYFAMAGGGEIDINVYFTNRDNFLNAMILTETNQVVDSWSSVDNPDFPLQLWTKINLALDFSNPSANYTIRFLGMAGENNLGIDSFRYIPPNYEYDCNFYEEVYDTTSTTSETETETPTTVDNEDTSTEDSPSTVPTTTENDLITEGPTEDENLSSWNTLTIVLVTIGAFLLLVVISSIFYWLGKRKAKSVVPKILVEDIDNQPRTVIIPRVK